MTSHPAKVGSTVRSSASRNITTRLPRKCAETTAKLIAECEATAQLRAEMKARGQ